MAKYASGIGPYHGMLVNISQSKPSALVKTDLVAAAKAANLLIHPYTFR